MASQAFFAGYYYRSPGDYVPVRTKEEFNHASTSGFSQEIEGAQVGSCYAPRNSQALRRVDGSNFPQGGSQTLETSYAPTGYVHDEKPQRISQYNQNWNGIQTSDTWQQFLYPNQYRPIISNARAMNVLLGRTGIYPNARLDRTAIAINQYALNTKAVSAGTYQARNPRGGG